MAAALLSLAAASSVVGAAAEKGKCAVSGKEIEITEKTPRSSIQGKAVYFCCENCPKAFAKTPEKFVKGDLGKCPVQGSDAVTVDAGMRRVINNGVWYVCCPGCADSVATSPAVLKSLNDVVSNKTFTATASSPKVEYKGQVYLFQNAETKAQFEKDPAKYALVFTK